VTQHTLGALAALRKAESWRESMQGLALARVLRPAAAMFKAWTPIALLGALQLSAFAAIPLSVAAPELGVAAIAIFALSMAALAWWLIRTDRASDPELTLVETADRFDERWPSFERDFWAHVEAREAAARLD
jgi:hypothetical protein